MSKALGGMLSHPFVSKVKLPKVRIFKDTCFDKWHGWLLKAWKEKHLKVKGNVVQGRGMSIALVKWAQGLRYFVFLINSHQRPSTTEGALNNQEDRVTWPVICHDHPAPAVLYPIAVITDSWKTHGGKDGECTWNQLCKFPLKVNLAAAIAKHPTCQPPLVLTDVLPKGTESTTRWPIDCLTPSILKKLIVNLKQKEYYICRI